MYSSMVMGDDSSDWTLKSANDRTPNPPIRHSGTLAVCKDGRVGCRLSDRPWHTSVSSADSHWIFWRNLDWNVLFSSNKTSRFYFANEVRIILLIYLFWMLMCNSVKWVVMYVCPHWATIHTRFSFSIVMLIICVGCDGRCGEVISDRQQTFHTEKLSVHVKPFISVMKKNQLCFFNY